MNAGKTLPVIGLRLIKRIANVSSSWTAQELMLPFAPHVFLAKNNVAKG